MSSDANCAATLPRPPQRARASRPWLALLSALLDLAEGQAELLRHAQRSWASVTFSGQRHTVLLHFSGRVAVDAGERFIAALPDHEFTLARQLVADAAITTVTHTAAPEPWLEVEVELLVLDEV